MKTLLFTHVVDIDGMGSAVLSKLAFKNVDIIFCDTFEITEKLTQKLNESSLYDYDQIFVTDICPAENVLLRIENDELLKHKVKVFDHHFSILQSLSKSYEFAKIEVDNNFGKCSGTSLFYEYLTNKKFLKNSPTRDEFVELTRQYDTWEWKTKYSNEKANDLNIMFSILKKDKYVETYYNKLLNNFELFDEFDLQKIISFKEEQKQICENYIKTIHVETVNNFKVGVIDAMEDDYKNDVAETLKSHTKLNLDLVAMVITKRNTLSFRSIKPEIDVSKLAEFFGGKGHTAASSCVINNKVKSSFNIQNKNLEINL